ncbi:MAG TPA: acyl-CoA desaturase [Bacteroidetes bacterium]|nr:acyl-CoA desaturase [Bacteroidota bacterium]
MPVLIFFSSHWFLSLFFQTFFHHRYASHKMFTMSKVWERFFHFMTYVAQGSSYLTPSAYAIMHRMHHAYSDTAKDPHSPHFFKDVWGMMMHSREIFHGLVTKTIKVSPKFLGNYPEWAALDKFGYGNLSRLLWVIFYVVFYAFFATAWWMYLLLPFHFLMGPIHGAVVNWCGHKYGYQNFDNNDDSKNTVPFDFLMLGELFQNNHHKHPNSPNFAKKWWELDPVYPVLRLLHFLKIIKLRRVHG